jgi:hypothetical protein
MGNKGFNGTIVTWPTTTAALGQLRGISWSGASADIDVTGSTYANHMSVAGKKRLSCTVDLVGGTTVVTCTTGHLGIKFFDKGTEVGLHKAVCVGRDVKGSMDGEITTSLKFAKAST